MMAGALPIDASHAVPEPSRRIDVVLNAGSGAPGKEPLSDQVRALLIGHGFEPRVLLAHHGRQLEELIRTAATGPAPIVVAGGGDGTIAGVAEAIAGTGKTLGVLPLGTFNYFARRFSIPSELEGALAVIAGGQVRSVTIGDVNGRVFLNNASIGLYTDALRRREHTYKRLGRSRTVAYLSAAFTLLRRRAPLDLHIVHDGEELRRRTPLLFVGANPYQLDEFGIEGASCVERGQLALCVTRADSGAALWRLATRGFFRGLDEAEGVEVSCAREIVVTTRRSSRLRVAVDGELIRVQAPLRIRARPDALRVLVPTPSG